MLISSDFFFFYHWGQQNKLHNTISDTLSSYKAVVVKMLANSCLPPHPADSEQHHDHIDNISSWLFLRALSLLLYISGLHADMPNYLSMNHQASPVQTAITEAWTCHAVIQAPQISILTHFVKFFRWLVDTGFGVLLEGDDNLGKRVFLLLSSGIELQQRDVFLFLNGSGGFRLIQRLNYQSAESAGLWLQSSAFEWSACG